MAKKFRNKSFKKILSIILTTTVLLQMFTGVVQAAEENAAAAEQQIGYKVRVTTDGQSIYYQTEDKTVEEFLKNNNINAEDYKIDVELTAPVSDGMQIKLNSLVTVNVDINNGEDKFSYKAKAETIGQLMLELKEVSGVTYKVADGYSSSEKLKEGMEIALRAVKEEIYVEQEEIPFATVEQQSDELYEGETKIVQEGSVGIKEETMKNVYYGDELVDNFCIERKVAVEPVNRIIMVGTKKKEPVTSGTVNGMEYSKIVTMNATAYCPCAVCNGKWAGRPSALGLKVEKGVVAVDPSFIPLGTKLYVEGYGYCVAGDTGGAIKGNRIDLCYNSHSEALNSGWGHTNVKVYILK